MVGVDEREVRGQALDGSEPAPAHFLRVCGGKLQHDGAGSAGCYEVQCVVEAAACSRVLEYQGGVDQLDWWQLQDLFR